MKISILGSGSRGNSIYIENKQSKFLVDAGFSCKKIENRLNNIGRDLKDIDALVITHEHGDHIQGAGIISRKYDIPIYITKESFEAGEKKIGKVRENNIKFIDGDFMLNDDILIKPFDVMHDASRTLGFRIINDENKKIAISTDIGYINNIIRKNFLDVDAMIIESNYDHNLLMKCGYPWELKARVKSRNGHLSNDDAANFIKEMYSEKLKKIYLAHISQDSNNRDLLRDNLESELKASKIRLDYEMACQDVETKIFKL